MHRQSNQSSKCLAKTEAIRPDRPYAIEPDESNCFDELPIGQQEVSRKTRPFILKFKTKKNLYIYDVNTGRIVRVDSLLWDLIDDIGKLDHEEIVQKHVRRGKAVTEILASLEEISHAQTNKLLFLSNRPSRIPILSRQGVENCVQHYTHCVHLHVTENCNFRCLYCEYEDLYAMNPNRAQRKMEWDIAKLAIDDFLDHSDAYGGLENTKGIGFYGGEPLLNLDLIKQCVRYVRKRTNDAVPFRITTNGSLLTGSTADFLAEEHFHVCVSIDGPQQIHDSCRIFADGSGTHRVVMENLYHFLDKYPNYDRLSVNTVLTHPKNNSAIQKFFSSNSCFSPSVSNIYSPAESDNEAFCRYMDNLSNSDEVWGESNDYQEYLAELADGEVNADPKNTKTAIHQALWEEDFRMLHLRKIDQRGAVLRGPVGSHNVCVPGVSNPQVTVDGDYYPCQSLLFNDTFKIGNVWQGRDSRKIYKLLVDFHSLEKDRCASCWCAGFCCVGCFLIIADKSQPASSSKQRQCKQYQRHMHNVLIDYCTVVEKNPKAFHYLK